MSLAAALCYHPLFLGELFGVKICPSCRVQFPDESRVCPSEGKDLRQLGEGDPRFGTVANDNYLFLDLLGRGGMGVVYKAHQLDLERDVAIKILSGPDLRDKEWITRFEHEARVIAQLKDEHTIKPIGRGTLPNGEMYIAMELIEGQSLSMLLSNGGPLPPDRLGNLMIQICDALEEAHAKGLVHRDLKPSNIMVERRKNGEHVKLLDFGLAKKIDRPSTDRISWADHFYGTPEYMAPEQWDSETFGEVGPQTDIYALGVMMFELLKGELPFEARDATRWMYKHMNEAPPRLLHVAFDRVVQKCMAKSQGERYANVAELRADIEKAARDDTIGTPVGLERPAPSPRSFNLMRELARGATAQFLAFALMIVALALVVVHEVTKEAPLVHLAPASISVNSNPPGAAILLDGEPTGLTTPTVLQVVVKDRTVELSVQKDQKIASRPVRLESGKRENVTLVLGARTE
jgi:serine/threonine protein kinase